MPAENVSPTATLTEVHTVTPANGLKVTSDAYFTYSNTKYYKTGTTVKSRSMTFRRSLPNFGMKYRA